MDLMQIAKREVLDEESAEENDAVIVTKNGNYICE